MPIHGHIMHLSGWIMILIYLHLWFAPYKRFKQALISADIPAAGAQLNKIRILVTTNLFIGLATAIIGSTGRYW